MTTLEYMATEQIPATIAAMNHGSTLIYELTVANGEAIAGLRVDMASLETVLRNVISDLRHAMAAQGDTLRKQIGVATAGFRADVTGLRETTGMRFQKVDARFNGFHAEMSQRFGAVDQRFDAVDQRFDAVDQRFGAVDQRFDAVDQRFDAVDQRFESVDAQLRDLRVEMNAKFDTILTELRRPAD
jgi:tetrahydromethanopterin S-methyltransferase subunit G